MRIAVLFALVQLSLATAVSDGLDGTLTALELNLQLSGDQLSPFYESSIEDTGVHFVRGSRSAEIASGPDIDVKCGTEYMEITVEFPYEYDGIIYSRGYLSDPKCKYVSQGGSQSRYQFKVPLDGCGTKPLCSSCGTLDNVLVFQADELIQGSLDFARKVSCSKTSLVVTAGGGVIEKHESHTLKLKPFMVDMLDVVAVESAEGGVQCWMDIVKGIPPDTSPLTQSAKIGEQITIVMYLKDPRNIYKLKVHECFAYDSPDYDSPKTQKVQLTDLNGCPLKPKIFSNFKSTNNTGKSEATLIKYSEISVFRFPDTPEVSLACSVELCTENCESQCEATKISLLPSTTEGPYICCPGDTDPRCPQPEPKPKTTTTTTTTTTPKPITLATTTKKPTTITSTTPKPRTLATKEPTTITSTTPKPRTLATKQPTTITSTTPKPRTLATTTKKLITSTRFITTTQKPTISTRKFITFTTPIPTKYPNIITTFNPPVCYPGSADPRCPQFPSKLTPLPYLPPPPPKTTEEPYICCPGDTDPRCPQPPPKITTTTTTKKPITTTRKPITSSIKQIIITPKLKTNPTTITTPKPTTTTPQPTTTPKPTTTTTTTPKPTTTTTTTTTTTPKPTTTTTTTTTTTSKPTTTPKPTTTTTTTPKPKITTTLKPKTEETYICCPGDTDPRCPQPTTTTLPPKPKIITTTPSPCFPGSKDPRCPQPSVSSSTNGPFYLPPEEQVITTVKPIDKDFDFFRSILDEVDNFEYIKVNPQRQRAKRDLTSSGDAILGAINGTATVYVAIGFLLFAVFSVTIAIYIVKRNKSKALTIHEVEKFEQ